MLALGVDIGVRKGQDLVLLETPRSVVFTQAHVEIEDVAKLIVELRPDVVAIDAPPRFGDGAPRLTEVLIRRRGIQLFATPWLPEKQASKFYDWMREGFRVYEAAARAGFPLYGGGTYAGSAFEVFPYAVAVVLSGALRPKGVAKERWRRGVLHNAGVDTALLRTVDQVDAALAALGGLYAIEGRACWEGEPSEGVIVLPCRETELKAKYASP